MGGTSCDVCVVEGGEVRRTDSREIDGRPIQLPMVDVHTVGAGGGSIGWRDSGGALRVGPALGRRRPRARLLRPRRRPSRPSPTPTSCSATSPRDSQLAGGVDARRRGGRAARSPSSARSLGLDALETAAGIVRVANQEMVRALRVVTVERGVDPRGFALLPFGGAGPMHAAAIAAELGIETDPLPARRRRPLGPRPLRLRAPPRHRAHGDAERRGADRRADRRRGRGDWSRRPAPGLGEDAEPEVAYELRYAGQAFELPVPGPADPDPAELVERFERAHEERYGHRDPEGEVVLVDIGLALVVPGPAPRPVAAGDGAARARARRRVRFDGEWVETPVLRGEPAAGTEAEGPVVFELPEATFVLPPGWTRRASTSTARSRADGCDAIRTSDERSTRSRSRSWSAACAPPATRWARR